MPLSLLLVDDHALVRDGLRRILSAHNPAWAIHQAESAHQALEQLRQHHIDVLVTDISMPGLNGLELLKRAKLRQPQLHVLVLSMHEEQQYALRAYKAGASGYLTKDSSADKLLDAIHKVASGGVFISGDLAEQVVQHMSGSGTPPSHALLTDREMDVLRRLVGGQRLTDIADHLHLSIKTISTHKSRILEKLQLPNLAALVRYGMEHRLVADGVAAPELSAPPARAGAGQEQDESAVIGPAAEA